MNFAAFVAGRLYKNRQSSFSKIVQQIAVATIAIGLAVMMGSYMILGGFQESIKNKVYDMSGHFQVKKYSFSNQMVNDPIYINFDSLMQLEKPKFIEHTQGFALKPALLKEGEVLKGVLFKGLGPDADTSRISLQIKKGRYLRFDSGAHSQDILISRLVADRLNVDVDSMVSVYFVQDPPRFRRLRVCGIIETEVEEVDQQLVIGDIQLIRLLNNWGEKQVGGYEVFRDPKVSDQRAEQELLELTGFQYRVDRASELYFAIFDWLTVINKNATLVLVLVLIVASLNLLSVLIILSMERTRMIGILKSLGSRNAQVRNIFTQVGIRLILKGMLYGNGIGILFGAVQYYFHILPLDAENYYISYVPIYFNWTIIGGLNVLVLGLVSLVLVIPSAIISRTQPVKALRFS